MAALYRRREDLYESAGVALARGLPWEMVWRGPPEALAAIERGFRAEKGGSE